MDKGTPENSVSNAGRQTMEALGPSDWNKTQRRKRGRMEIQPFGDCWVEMMTLRECLDVTKDLR